MSKKKLPPEEYQDAERQGSTNDLFASVREWIIREEFESGLISQLLEEILSQMSESRQNTYACLPTFLRCWVKCTYENGLDPTHSDDFGGCVEGCMNNDGCKKHSDNSTRSRWTALLCLLILKYFFDCGWFGLPTLEEFLDEMIQEAKSNAFRRLLEELFDELDGIEPFSTYAQRQWTEDNKHELSYFDEIIQQYLAYAGLKKPVFVTPQTKH